MEPDPATHGLPIGLGTANLGNLYRALTDDEAWQILDTAWEHGIRHFDTAPHYGLGLAERRLGVFLATKPREQFVVSTKVGRLLRPSSYSDGRPDYEHDFVVPADHVRVWDFGPVGIRRSLEESLDRLGLDAVDIAYLHDPERFDLSRGMRIALPELARMRSEGCVGSVGVASMSTEALVAAVRTGVPDRLMVAGRLTLADHAAADPLVGLCDSQCIAVVAAAVFNSGVLVDGVPTSSSRFDYAPVPADVLGRTQRIAAVCAEFDVSLSTAAVQYPLRFPGVRTVVVGSASPDEIHRNIQSMRTPVPPALWRRLVDDGLVAR